MSDRLWTERRRVGPLERDLRGVRRALVQTGELDDVATMRLTLCRTVARSLDRLEHDPDRSEHTVGANARVLAGLLTDLTPTMSSNDVDDLLAALAAPVRADPAT